MTHDTITSADFLAALDCWTGENPHFRKQFKKHWFNQSSALEYSRSHQGILEDEPLQGLKLCLKRFEESSQGDGIHPIASRVMPRGDNEEDSDRLARQFVCVTRGLLYGVLAAHELSGWEPRGNGPFSETAVDALKRCLEHYHEAWNLYTPPVRSDQLYHPAASLPVDKASAILAQFGRQFIDPNALPKWWTQSNWLLVRRLLSYLLNLDDSPNQGDPNLLQMLLVAGNSQDDFRGLVAPVRTALMKEAWPTAYLDPVALGVTTLDDRMLDSLRVASRICRPLLETQQRAVRIGLQTRRFYSLSGASAGGLVTLGTIATANGLRLNRDWSASFTVKLSHAQQQRLVDPEEKFFLHEVKFGAVSAESVEFKITSEEFRKAGLKTVLLHNSQKSGPKEQLREWKDWVPHAERHSSDLKIIPISEGQTLSDLIELMTGDERIEQVMDRHADSIHEVWLKIENATPESPRSLQDERDEHRFDKYVPPGFHIEKSVINQKPEQSHQARPEYESDPVPGEGDEPLRELLRRMIQDEKFLVVYDKAGAGKTVFSWRMRYLATSKTVRTDLFDGHAPLTVRCDGEWPRHEQTQQFLTLRELLSAELAKVTPRTVPIDDILKYVLERRRVLLILDGFDQFEEEARQHVVDMLNSKGNSLAQDCCRWIITSRVHTIDRLRHVLFDDKHWLRVTIDPFTPEQQDLYFSDLGERWLPTVPNRDAVADLLQLPLVLRMIRRLIEQTDSGSPLPVFHTLSELFVITARMLLERAIEKSSQELSQTNPDWGNLSPAEQLRLLEEVLSLLAFQMLLDENYNGVLDDDGRSSVCDFELRSQERFCNGLNLALEAERLAPSRKRALELKLDERLSQWNSALKVLKTIELNHRSVTEAYQPERIAFRSRKIMECYAARYLTLHATDHDRQCVTQFLGDEEWTECWKLAIDMPATERDRNVSLAAYRMLFDIPQHHPRPTELMYRVWAMFQQQPGLSDEWQGILSEYRQQFLDILGGEELDQAQRAAEVLWEEDVRQLVAERKTGKWTFEQLRQDAAEHPSYAFCGDKNDSDHLTFMMGASLQDENADEDEKPWQKVQTDAFFMATCCITRAQYRLFDPQRERLHQQGEYGFSNIAPDEDCPMIYANWFDSFCFALWLGEKYRLPSEIEWEGAAWGGIDRKSIEHQNTMIGVPPFDGTFTTDSVNFKGNYPLSGEKSTSLGRTLPVKWDENRRKAAIEADSPAAQLPHYFPNDFGLWHMNGNVWEWCRSVWIEDLTALIAAADSDYVDTFVHYRSIRGGSWGDSARSSRTSFRGRDEPVDRGNYAGFRLSRTL